MMNQQQEARLIARLVAANKRAEIAEAQVKNVLDLCDKLERKDDVWQIAIATSFRNAVAEKS